MTHMINMALLQMNSAGTDQEANLAKGESFCRRAKEMGADVALFPEMWNVGYTPFYSPEPGPSDLWRAPERWHGEAAQADSGLERARARWQARAVGRDGEFVTHFCNLARELEMAIAITYLEEWDGPPRNSLSIVDHHGEIVLTYAKVHTCDFDHLDASCTPGEDFPVVELETREGAVKVGAMICHDREFPEPARILMLGGAELILVPNSCELEANRIGQFRARAFENMVGVAMTNYAAPQENGHSVAFDPMAFDGQERSRNTLVVEAGEPEGVYLAAFDLDAIRKYRSKEVWGNAFRRPHRYGSLTSLDVEEPFVRVDSWGQRYDPTRR
jgi:N-carbamoylputrescine amidase